MVDLVAPERYTKAVSGVRTCAVGFLGQLDTDELLTSVALVEEVGYGSETDTSPTTVGSADLTLDQKAVNTAAIDIKGESHVAGKAVQFRVADGVAGRQYWARVAAVSDGGQTIYGQVRLDVVAD